MGDKEPWGTFGQSLWTRLYSKGFPVESTFLGKFSLLLE